MLTRLVSKRKVFFLRTLLSEKLHVKSGGSMFVYQKDDSYESDYAKPVRD